MAITNCDASALTSPFRAMGLTMNRPLRSPPSPASPAEQDIEARLTSLGPPPELADLTDDEMDARADAEIAAGRFISAARVAAWLEALKTDPHAPRPEPDVCDG